MPLRVTHNFTTPVEAQRILQEAQGHFSAKCDYRVEAREDSRLEFRRGKNALGSWMGYKIQDTPTVLTLQVTPADGGNRVSCLCEVDTSRRTPMRGDKDFLYGELEKFQQRLARL
ncbi:MAG: hypothetical protein HY558_00360 [Euryarchaeota archaeon]|nr:hypothetical protein [Euryarchaeota archaeon]